MSFKVHTPPDLTEEEMLERVRQYQTEKENEQLLHFDNVEQLRESLSSAQRDEA